MAFAILEKTLEMKLACMEIIEGILESRITKENFETEKISISNKYKLVKILKNAEIFQFVDKEDKNYEFLKRFFKIKPIRTSSGVANISVMWLDKENKDTRNPDRHYSCPAACVYCAQGTNAPKSYTGCEPTTMRAIRNDYDPVLQVTNRIKQLHVIGHSTDKCEIIVMGGTFTSMPFVYQEKFITGCFDALNEDDSQNLYEAHIKNESAKNRCVGLTIETRADFCRQHHVNQMLQLGCTRVEIGVQSTSDRILEAIKRGHSSAENIHAIKLLKDNGLKFTAHWMPGLTGLLGEIDEKEEIRLFKELFANSGYMPDELKIYPVLVLPGTELYDLWNDGNYNPLTNDQMLNLLIEMKKIVPTYVRIKRVMRDISEHEVKAGASTTNLRQLAKIRMEKLRIKCSCIRCREIGLQNKQPKNIELHVNEYQASEGVEFFISCEDKEEALLLGFIRLRISNGKAFIRELHVYGEMTPIGEESKQAQHKGVGKKLLSKAEEMTKEFGLDKLFVMSGIGVRGYYRKLGYTLEGPYMVKKLD